MRSIDNAAAGGRLARLAYAMAGVCAAVALAGIMLLMLFDVTGRYVFNSPIPGAAEVIELLMGIVIFAALPLTTAQGEHVKLDYFDALIKGRVQRTVNFAVETVSAVIVGFLAWRVAAKAQTIFQYHDTTPFLNIPVGPVAVFIAGMTAVTALIFLFKALAQLSRP